MTVALMLHMHRPGVTTLCGFPAFGPIITTNPANVTCPLCLRVLAYEIEMSNT